MQITEAVPAGEWRPEAMLAVTPKWVSEAVPAGRLNFAGELIKKFCLNLHTKVRSMKLNMLFWHGKALPNCKE